MFATRIFAAAARRFHRERVLLPRLMGVPGAHQAETEAAVSSTFPKLASPPRPLQRCPRRACRSDAHVAAIGLVACGAGGAAQARRVLRDEYAPPAEPNRPAVAAAVVSAAAAGAPASAFLDRTSTALSQQCATEAKQRRYFFGGGALLVGQAVLSDRRSQFVGLRCGSPPTVVLRNSTSRCANSRSMAKPPAVGGWSSNLTPATRCYTFAAEAHE